MDDLNLIKKNRLLEIFKIKLSPHRILRIKVALLTFFVIILLMALTGTTIWSIFTQKEANRSQELFEESEIDLTKQEDKKDDFEGLYLGLVGDYIDVVTAIGGVKTDEFTENFIYMTCTAYSSKDKGVNNISAIGMNIAKWDKYTNFCAINPEDPNVEYGDTIIVEISEGIYEAYLAVDTGAEVGVGELDLYWEDDQQGAINFGVQKLRVWIIPG